ncbi:hypothetical protein C0995_002370 [Termitomyces sp. Mi166|nr:hypothetical protein C0995_002370 [Termitomyces sp. Mi166\
MRQRALRNIRSIPGTRPMSVPTDPEIFFGLVTFLALRTVNINANPQKGRWDQRSFINVLHHSQCSLTELSLFNVKIIPVLLIEYLEVLSALVEFHVEGGLTKLITQSVVLTYQKEKQQIENPDLRFFYAPMSNDLREMRSPESKKDIIMRLRAAGSTFRYSKLGRLDLNTRLSQAKVASTWVIDNATATMLCCQTKIAPDAS